MIVTYDGSAVKLSYLATVDGAPVNPTTITASFKPSGGAWTTPAVMTNTGPVGSFTYAYLPPAAGYYSVRVKTTNPERVEMDSVAVLGTG